jgi:hypothetical protein
MILQQQLLNFSDVAFLLKLRGVTASGVILNIFPPFTKLPRPAKNVGSH